MKDVKDIVRQNLVALRKTNGYTQMELAKKINYSDKAISRWENGEVTPDVETLQVIADVYNVPITYLLEKHEKVINDNSKGNIIATQALSVFVVWTIATTLFVYYQLKGNCIWQLFVWAIPASCLICAGFNYKYWHSTAQRSLIFSVLTWTLLTAIYLQMVEHNQHLWLIFIIGIPIQVCIIIASFIKIER